MNYNKIKEAIRNNNFESLNNLEEFSARICKKYNFTFDKLIVNLIHDDHSYCNRLESSYLYFRFYYFFYLIVIFMEKEELNKNEISQVFDIFLKYTSKNFRNKNSNKGNEFWKKFMENHDYLYETFFIKENCYWHTYFNNTINYFFPLPYKFLFYYPLVTFADTNTYFHHVSFETNFSRYDMMKHINRTRQSRPLNKNMIKEELTFHVPLKYFSNKTFNKDDKVLIFYKGNKAFIGSIKEFNNKALKIQTDVIRDFRKTPSNFKHFRFGAGFQLVHPMWKEISKEITLHLNEISYLQVYRKLTKNKLFDFYYGNDISNIKYLFHNTDHPQPQKIIDSILNNQTFFFSVPWPEIDNYFAKRKCILFEKIKNPKLLDLTKNKSSINPFTFEELYNKHKKEKFWMYPDQKLVLKEKFPKEVFNDLNACIRKDNNLEELIKNRPYCDIGFSTEYNGRRKLQEILFKSRKHKFSNIYLGKYQRYLKKIKLDVTNIHKNLYYPDTKWRQYIPLYDFDTYVLKDMNIDGFFFTNYESNIDGGEILLTTPSHFITLNKINNSNCPNI